MTINYQIWPERPTMSNKLLSLWKFQVFKCRLPGDRDKASQILYYTASHWLLLTTALNLECWHQTKAQIRKKKIILSGERQWAVFAVTTGAQLQNSIWKVKREEDPRLAEWRIH